MNRLRLAWSEMPKGVYIITCLGTALLWALAQNPLEKAFSALLTVLHVMIWLGFYYKAVEKQNRRKENDVSKTS